MKNLAFYFLLTVISYQAYAQDTTYFPNKLGNTWVYRYDDGRIEKQTIVRDSTDNLGNRFLSIKQDSILFNDWRFMMSPKQDSIFFLPKPLMELRYRFPIKGNGDKWVVKPKMDVIGNTPKLAKVTTTYDAEIFGKITTAYRISYFLVNIIHGDTVLDSRSWERDQIIAKGFGLVWEGIEVEYKTLVGCVINGDTLGYVPTVGVNDKINITPKDFALYQNYPNPFNPSTVISFYLPSSGNVQLKVYDMFGREVKTLVDDYMIQGKHSVTFNAGNLSSGLYFYKLTVGKSSITKKLSLIK